MTAQHTNPYRTPYALFAGGGCLLSAIGAAFVAVRTGAGESGLLAIVGVLALCVGVCIAPLMGPPLVTRERWGLVVMGASLARTLVVMGGMMVLIEAMHIDRRPVVYSLLTGGLMMMAIEAIVAALLLNRRTSPGVHAGSTVHNVPSQPQAGGRDAAC